MLCMIISTSIETNFFIKGNKDDLVHDAAPAPDDDEG